MREPEQVYVCVTYLTNKSGWAKKSANISSNERGSRMNVGKTTWRDKRHEVRQWTYWTWLPYLALWQRNSFKWNVAFLQIKMLNLLGRQRTQTKVLGTPFNKNNVTIRHESYEIEIPPPLIMLQNTQQWEALFFRASQHWKGVEGELLDIFVFQVGKTASVNPMYPVNPAFVNFP